VFQQLERSHSPYAVGFVPEYGADDGSKRDDEEVFAAETLQEKRQVRSVEDGAENRIKEVPWKKEFAQLHEMTKHTDFDLADENVVSADFLFLHQTQLAKLFKVMVCHAWAAEAQGALDFTYAHGFAVF